MNDIIEQLRLHEGLELQPYKDTVGKITIGIGRNLDDKGISKKEAYYLCENDIKEVTKQLQKYEWFTQLKDVRKRVLIDMAFNLGIAGLLSFKNMIQCLKDKEFVAAANEMINSKWHQQVKTRAFRLEKMMRTGKDYNGWLNKNN